MHVKAWRAQWRKKMILSRGLIKGVVVKRSKHFVVIKTTSNKTEVIKGVDRLLFTLWVNLIT